MNSHTTRRDVLRMGTHGALAATLVGMSTAPTHADPPKEGADPGKLWRGFPRQDQKRVAEVVGMAHFNEQRVRELVRACPELVNACWDWGFGDWETPLGAAAHVGHRGIAEFLLAHGARMDIFAAAMLGNTAVVNAFVVAQPGIQRTLGPHGIPLLAHAEAGGELAADTVAYLKSLGDAGEGLKVTPLADGDKKKYLGEFASAQLGIKLVCRLNNTDRLVVDLQAGEIESNGRIIHHVGGDAFFPAGVPSVRIRFVLEGGRAKAVTIDGSVPTVAMERAPTAKEVSDA